MIYTNKNYDFNRAYYINDYLLSILSKYKFNAFHSFNDLKKSTFKVAYIGEDSGIINAVYLYNDLDNIYYLIEE